MEKNSRHKNTAQWTASANLGNDDLFYNSEAERFTIASVFEVPMVNWRFYVAGFHP